MNTTPLGSHIHSLRVTQFTRPVGLIMQAAIYLFIFFDEYL